MLEHQHNQRLGLQNWKVDQAYSPTDINWDQINTIYEDDSFKQWALPTGNILFAFLVGLLFLYVDSFAFTDYPSFALILDYLCSFAFAYYILYISPNIQFILTNVQNIERKSHKEMQFLNKLNFMFIFNSLISPLLSGLALEYATDKGVNTCSHLVKDY